MDGLKCCAVSAFDLMLLRVVIKNRVGEGGGGDQSFYIFLVR